MLREAYLKDSKRSFTIPNSLYKLFNTGIVLVHFYFKTKLIHWLWVNHWRKAKITYYCSSWPSQKGLAIILAALMKCIYCMTAQPWIKNPHVLERLNVIQGHHASRSLTVCFAICWVVSELKTVFASLFTQDGRMTEDEFKSCWKTWIYPVSYISPWTHTLLQLIKLCLWVKRVDIVL